MTVTGMESRFKRQNKLLYFGEIKKTIVTFNRIACTDKSISFTIFNRILAILQLI